MTRYLDPLFALYVDFAPQAETPSLWYQEAERIAAACGYTFDDGIKTLMPEKAEAAKAARNRSFPLIAEPGPHLSTTPAKSAAELIADALAADPSRSDRDIARELRCSPTTVGRARAAAGLVREVRTVRRRGADYPMRLPVAGPTVPA